MSLIDDFMREIKDKVNNINDNVTEIRVTQAVHSQRLDSVDKSIANKADKIAGLQDQLVQLEKAVIEKTNETYNKSKEDLNTRTKSLEDENKNIKKELSKQGNTIVAMWFGAGGAIAACTFIAKYAPKWFN